jgi:hypothetical protein
VYLIVEREREDESFHEEVVDWLCLRGRMKESCTEEDLGPLSSLSLRTDKTTWLETSKERTAPGLASSPEREGSDEEGPMSSRIPSSSDSHLLSSTSVESSFKTPSTSLRQPSPRQPSLRQPSLRQSLPNESSHHKHRKFTFYFLMTFHITNHFILSSTLCFALSRA